MPAAETEISAIPGAAASAADTSRVGEPVREDTLIVLRDAPVIPGYQLLDVLGRGGMGIVYLAEQMSPRRIVALKTIIAGPLASPALNARFRREIEAVARVPHPNIITLFEIGEHQGHPFFTMEYLGGGTLADRIHEKRFSGDEAAAILVKLSRAVHSAHQFGFVHRDLKPSNILFTAEGTPKIADFGLVKWLTEAQDESPATRSGEVMGTLSYMSPEQACGNSSRVDATSDVYSLGVILYEMLTGRCPFVGNELISQILNSEVPSPAWLCPGISRDLERICLRALRKDSKDRYQTAEQFALDLERYLRREPIDKPSVWYRVKNGFRRQWKLHRRRLLTITAAVCLVAATATWAMTGYLYRWEFVRYYNNFTLHWLQVLGQGEVSAEDVASRFQTCEVVTRGRLGRAIRLTVVGSDGFPNPLNQIEPFLFDIREGLPSELKETSYLIAYNDAGQLVKQIALDSEGTVIWQFLADYSEDSSDEGTTIVIARYVDGEGNDIDTPTGAAKIRMTLNRDGWIERVDFLTGKGTPAASTQGYFGFRYRYDDEHRITRQEFIDADGKPMLNRDGAAGIDMKYDSRDRVVEFTYFDTQGDPTSTVFGLAAVHSTYDEFGNQIEVRGEGLDGSPAVLGERSATTAVSKEVYGFENGIWRTYTGYNVSNEVVVELSYDFEQQADHIVRSSTHYSAPGVVSGQFESVLDANYLEQRVCSQIASDATQCIVAVRDDFGRETQESQFAYVPAAIDKSSRPDESTVFQYEFGRLATKTVTTYDNASGETALPAIVHTVYEYDDAGRLIVERSYQGESADVAALFKLAVFEYDRRTGRLVGQSNYANEARSLPFHDPETHWSRLDIEYDSVGRLERHIYSGFPDDMEYSRHVLEFNAFQDVTVETYWTIAESAGLYVPSRGPLGWEQQYTTYDEFGLPFVEQSGGYDPDQGFTEIRVEYLRDERRKERTYWNGGDIVGHHPDGNHRWIQYFRENGSLVEERYVEYREDSPFQTVIRRFDDEERLIETHWQDANGDPVRNFDGYQGENFTYWPNGTTQRHEQWGLDVEAKGYPALVILYDEQGRKIQERSEDGQGNLFIPNASYAVEELVYEGDAHVETRGIAFDQEVYGVYQKVMRYDDLQRPVFIESRDEMGNCVPCRIHLFGRSVISYDSETETSLHVNTVLTERVGADRWVMVKDEDGLVLSEEFQDADGNLVTSNFGFARATIDYSTDPPNTVMVDADGQSVSCEVRIDYIEPGKTAEERGLLVGDVVLSYAEVPVSSRQVLKAVQDSLAYADKEIPIVVRRGDDEEVIHVPPGLLGVYWWEQPVTETP